MKNQAVRVVSGATLALVALGLLPAQQAVAVGAGPDFVYSVTPCRILDTRLGSGIFAGKLLPGETLSLNTYGGNIILQGGSQSNCPDIPSDATGIFMNIIAVEASGSFNNDLGLKPFGSALGGATAINYTPGVFALNNGLFAGTCWGQFLYGAPPTTGSCTQDISITNGAGASAHVVIDVTGFTRNF